MLINKQIFLKETPQGKLSISHFETISSDVTSPDDEKVLIETLYISIDAANRAWMQGRTYRDQILPGNLMAGFALGKIIETKSDNFKVGDIVEGDLGWQNYSLKSENEID